MEIASLLVNALSAIALWIGAVGVARFVEIRSLFSRKDKWLTITYTTGEQWSIPIKGSQLIAKRVNDRIAAYRSGQARGISQQVLIGPFLHDVQFLDSVTPGREKSLMWSHDPKNIDDEHWQQYIS